MKGLADRRVERQAKPTIKPTKKFGHPASVILFTLLIFFFSQVIAALIVEVGLAASHSGVSLDNSAFGQFVFILMAEGLAAYSVFWLVKRRGLGLSSIGLGRRPLVTDVVKGAIGFAIFYVLLIVANVVVSLFWPDLGSEKQDVGFNSIHTASDNVFALIALVILPPLGEETLVRGYLYSGLRAVWRFWPALLVTSLLFSAAHLELGSGGPLVWAAALDTFILSVVLVFLRERTGALYAGMLVHMLNNFIAFGVHFHG
jgi:membrane protease YdiL (CAAX protease family)